MKTIFYVVTYIYDVRHIYGGNYNLEKLTMHVGSKRYTWFMV